MNDRELYTLSVDFFVFSFRQHWSWEYLLVTYCDILNRRTRAPG